jgi:hypothetical protein
VIKYIDPYYDANEGGWILDTEVLLVARNTFTDRPTNEEVARTREEHKRVLESKL